MGDASAVAIAGVGTTGYRREQETSLPRLLARAAAAALDDAGLTPADVDGLVCEGAILPRLAPPDLIAQVVGIQPRFSAQWLIGGAGLVGAPLLAQMAIATGQAHTVLVVHGTGPDTGGDPYRYHAEDPLKAALEMPVGWYGQAVYFAAMAQRYGHEHRSPGAGLEAVAREARLAAARTPDASQATPLDHAAYQTSPYVAEPLRRADCCLISEGASAYVVTSRERARDLARPPVVVAGAAVAADDALQTTWFTQRDRYLETAAARSGPEALARAGVGPADVDVVELYDCFTITPLLQLEDIGLCPRGEAADLAAGGALALGGALPLNTHGGLLAYGFCLGISHLVEAVHQLRHDRGPGQVAGAEVALVGGLGVPYHATTVLTVDR